MTRIAVFGWGIVAPASATVEEFGRNLERAESWLGPFNGFGPDNFLVGTPKCDFELYRPWIDARFPPGRYTQLLEKTDPSTRYALAAFIQALSQNPGIGAALRELGAEAHVYVASCLGAVPTQHAASIAYYRAQRKWNHHFSTPVHNAALRAYLAGGAPPHEMPRDPSTCPDAADPDELLEAWEAFWCAHSDELKEYLAELRSIESLSVAGDVEAGKLRVLRDKRRRRAALAERTRAPTPPWEAVSSNALFNISNTAAAQISILGGITGFCVAPSAACATFSVTLKLAYDAIRRGDAKLVVIGACDPPPHPLTVSTFYSARVLSADGTLSTPLSELRGTHLSGGAAIWIVGDLEYGRSLGLRPLGMEPLAVGVSADAEHIITPSERGPRTAMQRALLLSGVSADEIQSWDLHATATPGDFQEAENLRHVLPDSVLVTARKGTFGHGMGVSGGWELTAQYLGFERGRLFPTPLTADALHAGIGALGQRFVFDRAVEFPEGAVGKLSMGVGGVNACVISRPWPENQRAREKARQTRAA